MHTASDLYPMSVHRHRVVLEISFKSISICAPTRKFSLHGRLHGHICHTTTRMLVAFSRLHDGCVHRLTGAIYAEVFEN
jgi:hypothetical protein